LTVIVTPEGAGAPLAGPPLAAGFAEAAAAGAEAAALVAGLDAATDATALAAGLDAATLGEGLGASAPPQAASKAPTAITGRKLKREIMMSSFLSASLFSQTLVP
jgi:hypothetical protein